MITQGGRLVGRLRTVHATSRAATTAHTIVLVQHLFVLHLESLAADLEAVHRPDRRASGPHRVEGHKA